MNFQKAIILAITLILNSCNIDNCSQQLGFKLDYHLFNEVNINGMSYCALVNKSLEGDKECILILSKLDVTDFASYQHGAVLIEVIDKITELEYLKLIEPLSKKQKYAIYYKLWAGLEFTQNKRYKGKNIDTAFPILIKYLK